MNGIGPDVAPFMGESPSSGAIQHEKPAFDKVAYSDENVARTGLLRLLVRRQGIILQYAAYRLRHDQDCMVLQDDIFKLPMSMDFRAGMDMVAEIDEVNPMLYRSIDANSERESGYESALAQVTSSADEAATATAATDPAAVVTANEWAAVIHAPTSSATDATSTATSVATTTERFFDCINCAFTYVTTPINFAADALISGA
ncbi:hypothetical protein BC939DRAFT_531096 [Gamsiella multidivaricata]|uniref:uncharacterized protein n=1 Tax=Gamsiella multidivaricata TaxID=101098 RepID=UPI002220BD8F|nr:uncharacterized protein BC939DRAFT_531096 [Gamsiella multidivaricata]KAI7819719.1 hypothetical protein BC939DRAFT_531096 [Gamsiella multidivaricata]